MAIVGISLDRKNPSFTADDFTFWMPQFTNYIATPEGQKAFNKIYALANDRIFYSIFGVDWELAMSYAIAHYLTLIGQQSQAPSGSTLGEVAGGGVIRGVLASASVGEFNKSYDLSKTMLDTPDAFFWNQTSYGAALMALLKTKAIPSIFVVTAGPIEKDPYQKFIERRALKNAAAEDDIRLGKEAYGVAGIKLTGIIPDYEGDTSNE